MTGPVVVSVVDVRVVVVVVINIVAAECSPYSIDLIRLSDAYHSNEFCNLAASSQPMA